RTPSEPRTREGLSPDRDWMGPPRSRGLLYQIESRASRGGGPRSSSPHLESPPLLVKCGRRPSAELISPRWSARPCNVPEVTAPAAQCAVHAEQPRSDRDCLPQENHKMSIRLAVGSIATALLALSTAPVAVQFGPQLGTLPPRGQPVAPCFEGWYANPDGTYTFSFGYHNFNTEEIVDIPVGPNNYIEPAEFDRGEQPTHFPVPPRRDRVLFTITVPAEYADGRQVYWHLRHNGQLLSVPGKVGVSSYQLDHNPKPAGSLPPILKFSQDGPELVGLKGTAVHPDSPGADLPGTPKNPVRMDARVGEPLTLRVWVSDNFAQVEGRDTTEIHVNWHKHQ